MNKKAKEWIPTVLCMIGWGLFATSFLISNFYWFIIAGIGLALNIPVIIQNNRDAKRKAAKQSKEWAILSAIREKERKEKELEKQQRHPRYIPATVKREVWRRDKGECVECGSKERLEYDHIIPFSKGGSNTARNMQLLCENCNRKKLNKIQ